MTDALPLSRAEARALRGLVRSARRRAERCYERSTFVPPPRKRHADEAERDGLAALERRLTTLLRDDGTNHC